MKRILRNTAAVCAVFAAAMLCLPSCESTPSGETLDTSELTEIVTFDSVNFANVKSGDTITVTTVAGKGLFQTSAPSSAVLSLSTKGTSGTGIVMVFPCDGDSYKVKACSLDVCKHLLC